MMTNSQTTKYYNWKYSLVKNNLKAFDQIKSVETVFVKVELHIIG